jgi:cell division protease FtsH
MIFGHDKVTSGASADIRMATKLSRAMATQFGMSDKLGPLMYGENEEEVFLGHSIARQQHVSDETQKLVDSEIKEFVNMGYETAKKIITDNLDDLHTIANGLLEYETLSGDEIRNLLDGKPPIRDVDIDTGSKPKSSAVPKAGNTKRGGEEPDAGGMEPQPQA